MNDEYCAVKKAGFITLCMALSHLWEKKKGKEKGCNFIYIGIYLHIFRTILMTLQGMFYSGYFEGRLVWEDWYVGYLFLLYFPLFSLHF